MTKNPLGQHNTQADIIHYAPPVGKAGFCALLYASK